MDHLPVQFGEGGTALENDRFAEFGGIKALLEVGADLYQTGEFGWFPLQAAVGDGYDPPQVACLAALIKAGADPNRWGGIGSSPPLMCAIETRCLETTRILVEAGIDVNWSGEDKTNCIHWCCCPAVDRARASVTVEILHLLLAAGADINKTDHLGETPVCWAAYYEQDDMLRALMKAGADVEKTDEYWGNENTGESAMSLRPELVKRVQRGMQLWAFARRSRTRIVCQLGGDTASGASFDSRVQAKVDLWLDAHGLGEWSWGKGRPHLAHYKRARLV